MYFKAQICLFNNFITILQDGKKRKFPTGKTIFPIPEKMIFSRSRFFPLWEKNSLSHSLFPVSRHPFPIPALQLFSFPHVYSLLPFYSFPVLLSQLSPSHYFVKTLELQRTRS